MSGELRSSLGNHSYNPAWQDTSWLARIDPPHAPLVFPRRKRDWMAAEQRDGRNHNKRQWQWCQQLSERIVPLADENQHALVKQACPPQQVAAKHREQQRVSVLGNHEIRRRAVCKHAPSPPHRLRMRLGWPDAPPAP